MRTMKKILLALAVYGSVSSASAALLEKSDVTGRLMIVDQENGKVTGVLNISENKAMKIQAKVTGKELKCGGTYEFDMERQLLVGQLDCGSGVSSSLTLDLQGIEILSYLQGGLATAHLGIFVRKGTSGPATDLFSGSIDIKKLE